MKKMLLTLLIGALLALAACSGEVVNTNEEATEKSGSSVAEESQATEEEEAESTATLEAAGVGDVVVDEDYGEYEIVKVANPEESAETADVSVTLSKVLLATFTPNNPDMFGGESELPVVVTLVSAENGADGEVSFDPFNGDVNGNEAVMGLNIGESLIASGDTEVFVTAYHVDSTDISSADIFIKSPSQDAFSIGDDVEFSVTFE